MGITGLRGKTNMRIWPFISLLAFTGCKQFLPLPINNVNGANTTSQQPNPKITGVVLAMGQSNMAGGGGHPNQRPSDSFAQLYPNVVVYNCAVGGTSIASWGVGNLTSQCISDYEHGNLKVIGILWYQGESDAANGMTNWDAYFIALVNQWRLYIGNVPVIYAQLGTHDPVLFAAPTWDLIKTQQASLQIPYSLIVKTDDLPRVDNVHLTAEAALIVGQRMAKAFQELTND